ncbi:MAG: type II toxin-antitoxin system RelB/DinJ family antitoxin [bacterium]|nr:type II toxin-antitoxin system RelB/DinJ family antitoxin [bacterium]
MNTQVNFRTNKKTLARADKIFQNMGMDRSTALNMFLTRVEAERGLPFTAKDPAVIRAKWDKEIAAAKKTKGYKSTKEMMKAILG